MKIEDAKQDSEHRCGCIICASEIQRGDQLFRALTDDDKFVGPACVDCATTPTPQLRQRLECGLTQRQDWNPDILRLLDSLLPDFEEDQNVFEPGA